MAIQPEDRAEVKASCYEQIAGILRRGLPEPPLMIRNLLALNNLESSYREKILFKFVDTYLELDSAETVRFNSLLESKGVTEEVVMFKLKEEEIAEARKEQEFRDKYIASIRKLLSKHSISVSSEQAQAIKALSTDDLVQLQDGLIFDRITSNQQLQDWFGDKPIQQQSTSERAEGMRTHSRPVPCFARSDALASRCD